MRSCALRRALKRLEVHCARRAFDLPRSRSVCVCATPCSGSAGGRLTGQGSGSAGADYVPTPNAKLGATGSALPKLAGEAPTVWTAGGTAEVAWTVKAFHGGGYSYRLCPADSELTGLHLIDHHI